MISSERGSFISDVPVEELQDEVECITVEQLQQLVRLLDQSDTLELEVKHGVTKTRLVMRKSRPQEEHITVEEPLAFPEKAAESSLYTITSPCVGLFQHCPRPEDKPLAVVGDVVKEGQHVGAVRSMGIPNEVESPVMGRVIEIFVQEGQAVEYGQPLMAVEQQ